MNNTQSKTGTVVSLDGGLARVQVRRSSSCAACSCSGICSPLGREWMMVEAVNHPGAGPGQEVILAYTGESELKASFILYIIPLLSLLLGSVLGIWLDPLHNPDLSSVSLGFALMILSFLGIRFYSSRTYSRKKQYQPVILQIIPSDQPLKPDQVPGSPAGAKLDQQAKTQSPIS
ncbi:MAG: SoxR reducing system RseC family protein [Desulfonatronovibrionaceae bacterium]